MNAIVICVQCLWKYPLYRFISYYDNDSFEQTGDYSPYMNFWWWFIWEWHEAGYQIVLGCSKKKPSEWPFQLSSLAANDWPQNGRPPGAKSPTFFVGKSRLSSNFPLLVSQLGSIPWAMFWRSVKFAFNKCSWLWFQHPFQHIWHWLRTLPFLKRGQSLNATSSRITGAIIPQWKVNKRVVHPSWAWIVFFTTVNSSMNCRFNVNLTIEKGLNPEVVPKLHWCPGISNWNPRAEGAQTWVGRLSCFYVKSSKNGRFDHRVTHHSDISDVAVAVPIWRMPFPLSGGPSGVSILFPLFCLHWATAGVQKTRPGRLGFWAQDFLLVGINPMRLHEDVINAINSNILHLLIKGMIKQQKCLNKFYVVVWNPSATLGKMSHLNIYLNSLSTTHCFRQAESCNVCFTDGCVGQTCRTMSLNRSKWCDHLGMTIRAQKRFKNKRLHGLWHTWVSRCAVHSKFALMKVNSGHAYLGCA